MYESFYKFRGKPFQLSPDARFFYKSHGHKRALSYLLYGVKQGEGFIVITGDVGTGKTTLAQALFKVLEHEEVVAAQLVSTQIQEDDLLRMVASAFGLPYEGVSKASLLRNLEGYFRTCHEEGKRLLLVVDESQNLPPRAIEELRMLSNFQVGNRMLLQSFLLGQKEFRVTMRSEGFEQLRQRVIAAYHLGPLNVEETRGYIEHRLRKVGWRGDPGIADEVYGEVHSFTNGVPRRINTLCDRLFLHAFLEELHDISHDTVLSVTKDIVEEHGATVTSPGLAEEPAARAEMALGTVRRVDGGGIAGKRRVNGAGSADQQDAEARLAEMQQSVDGLTEALRQELALLRKAMQGGGKEE